MGTRGFVGFVVDGTEKIAYNHSDSYPRGLGRDVLSWLRHQIAVNDGLAWIRFAAGTLRVVTDETPVTDDDIERLRPFTDRGRGRASTHLPADWYQLLRRTQGKPDEILRAGVIEDASDFPLCSLFAEWGYVVDLDAETLEVYRGFQQHHHSWGRFAGRTGADMDRGWYPCALLRSWPLSDLPDDGAFVAALEGEKN